MGTISILMPGDRLLKSFKQGMDGHHLNFYRQSSPDVSPRTQAIGTDGIIDWDNY